MRKRQNCSVRRPSAATATDLAYLQTAFSRRASLALGSLTPPSTLNLEYKQLTPVLRAPEMDPPQDEDTSEETFAPADSSLSGSARRSNTCQTNPTSPNFPTHDEQSSPNLTTSLRASSPHPSQNPPTHPSPDPAPALLPTYRGGLPASTSAPRSIPGALHATRKWHRNTSNETAIPHAVYDLLALSGLASEDVHETRKFLPKDTHEHHFDTDAANPEATVSEPAIPEAAVSEAAARSTSPQQSTLPRVYKTTLQRRQASNQSHKQSADRELQLVRLLREIIPLEFRLKRSIRSGGTQERTRAVDEAIHYLIYLKNLTRQLAFKIRELYGITKPLPEEKPRLVADGRPGEMIEFELTKHSGRQNDETCSQIDGKEGDVSKGKQDGQRLSIAYARIYCQT
jgi:hypothetical protein